MVLTTRAIVVEGKDGVKRLEELKEGLISGDRVVAHVDAGEQVEVIAAIYRSRPLQLRYFLKVRFLQNGQETVAECRVAHDGTCILREL